MSNRDSDNPMSTKDEIEYRSAAHLAVLSTKAETVAAKRALNKASVAHRAAKAAWAEEVTGWKVGDRVRGKSCVGAHVDYIFGQLAEVVAFSGSGFAPGGQVTLALVNQDGTAGKRRVVVPLDSHGALFDAWALEPAAVAAEDTDHE
jgi:hypothetical protein